MGHILYADGKRVGEITGWTVIPDVPVYKNILGKIVLSAPKNDECTFVSPKPINRKAKLTVIQDGSKHFDLEIRSVKGSTNVTAGILGVDSSRHKR